MRMAATSREQVRVASPKRCASWVWALRSRRWKSLKAGWLSQRSARVKASRFSSLAVSRVQLRSSDWTSWRQLQLRLERLV